MVNNNSASFNGSSNLTTQGGTLPPGFMTTTTLNLGSLANNGGPTPTLALLPGSSAIRAGVDTTQGPYNLATDQRGLPRKSGGMVNIGAFEYQVPPQQPGDNGSPTVSPVVVNVYVSSVSITPNLFTLSATEVFTVIVSASTGSVSGGAVTVLVDGTAFHGTVANGQTQVTGVVPLSEVVLTQSVTASYGGSAGLAATTGAAQQLYLTALNELFASQVSFYPDSEAVDLYLFGPSLVLDYSLQGQLTGFSLSLFGGPNLSANDQLAIYASVMGILLHQEMSPPLSG